MGGAPDAGWLAPLQVDINLLELEAVHIPIGMLVAVRAREAEEVAKLCAKGFSRLEPRWPAVKAKHFREGGGSCPMLSGQFMAT